MSEVTKKVADFHDSIAQIEAQVEHASRSELQEVVRKLLKHILGDAEELGLRSIELEADDGHTD